MSLLVERAAPCSPISRWSLTHLSLSTSFFPTPCIHYIYPHVLFARAPIAIEGCFRAIISVILRLGEDQCGSTIQDLVKLLSADKSTELTVPEGAEGAEGDEGPEGAGFSKCRLRLKILLSVFNLCASHSHKYSTVVAIFQYALDTNQASGVASFYPRVMQWCDAWTNSISTEDKQNMHLLVRAVLVAAPGVASAQETRGFFLNYVGTFPSDKALPASAADHTMKALVEYIQTPVDGYDERNFALGAISEAHVSASADSKKLRALLQIICTGSLAEFSAYSKANAAVLSKHSINDSVIESNMRLFALCSLATMKNSLTYAEIASGLGISADEVEMTVVEAIASNVLEANMDQNECVVTITRCSYRAFSTAQWKDVQAKLNTLRADISSVFQNMNMA